MIGYIMTLGVLFGGYPIGVWAVGKIKRKRLFEVLFPFCTFVLYLCCVAYIAVDAGIGDWNFHNALPTANVSPFIYCLTAFIFVFPKSIRKYLYTLVALLSFGLLCAGAITCVFNILRGYAFHWQIAMDSLIHGGVSLFGVYLVKSGRVSLAGKTCLISGGILLGVAAVMMGLNAILHTSFFGLSVHGEHNIYNVVVCENGYLSAGLYFIGLCTVLAVGWLFQRLVHGKRIKSKNEK